MEINKQQNPAPLRYSVLGIIAFVMPLVVIITGLTLFLVHLPELMDTRLSYIETFFDRYSFILPLSFLCVLVCFAALKQRNTEKRMVKWGLVASAIPTIAIFVEMSIHLVSMAF